MKLIQSMKIAIPAMVIALLFSCSNDDKSKEVKEVKATQKESTHVSVLEKMDPGRTGVQFNNAITETNESNYFFNEYMYNGAGVAVADFNSDNLPDIFFTGNQVGNKLYINKGDWNFEDVTESAGVKGSGWHNGVAVADVNADGNLDLYVCRANSQEKNPDKRRNLLFINNGKGKFKEEAKKYGVDDPGYSLNAAFIDYDKDGDLDLYVTNYPPNYDLTFEEVRKGQNAKDQNILDHFYRNNGDGTFTEISKEVGTNLFGHGLGIGVGDLNRDGYPDIFVANDYATDDFLLINKEGKRFEQSVKKHTKHTSLFSMGLDIADYDNDGYLDIAVADMNPEDNFRSKAAMPSMNPDLFFASLNAGLHPQWMRNALHLNSDVGIFCEVGQMAGIPRTDWSWSMLFADIDNDGWKDLFISNGLMRDVDEKDINKELKKLEKERGGTLLWEEVEKKLNSTRIQNYWYRNKGDLTFEQINQSWGATDKTFSNGAAFADLDLDGDLDMIINNVNDPALLYRNNASEKRENNYLRVALENDSKNTFGYGTRIAIKTSNGEQFQELYSTRGYMSSSEPVAHFGLGSANTIETLIVDWPDGSRQVMNNVAANQVLRINHKDANLNTPPVKIPEKQLFQNVSSYTQLDFVHKENVHDDYVKQVLLPHEMSKFGPALAVGDVNGDGFEDVFIGGAANQAGQLYIQGQNYTFQKVSGPWELDMDKEDVDAVFVDFDGDGDQDLYVVSGGFEFPEGSSKYQDRLYLNTGSAFTQSSGLLPKINSSGGCVAASDFDGDGDVDLFVGGRVVPDKYPYAPDSYLLVNEGGKFADQTDKLGSDLREPGMIADAIWTDVEGDGMQELILVGDWTNPMIFSWNGSSFENKSETFGTTDIRGWWNSVEASDLDGDGDMDFVLGNLGLNYKYTASDEEPFEVYCRDFDDNGTFDIVLGYFYGGELYPVRGLQCSSEQMPFVKKKFPHYNEFGKANLRDIYGDLLDEALHLTANEFRSGILRNDNGLLSFEPLPQRAQISAVMGSVCDDFNSDGRMDVLVAGNLMVSEVETGNADASLGQLLLQDANGKFIPVTPGFSGFIAPNDVRKLVVLNKDKAGSLILVANNNDVLQSYGYTKLNQ